MLDNKLQWKTHVEVTRVKLSKAIGIIAKTRYFVTNTILTNLYYALFNSHIEYNLLNWCSADKTTLEPIKKESERSCTNHFLQKQV